MNEKWFALSLSEIEKKLKTNAASGLTRKAARSRWSADRGNVFCVPVKSPLSYFGELLGDFAFIMLMIMSFLALCFDESDTGIVTTVAIVIDLVAAFAIYYRSEFFCDSLERSFLPTCRIIREGKLFSVDGSHVVRGDVIMLEEGDILPCDVRLITSDRLKVGMLVEADKYILLDKAAESRVGENENDLTKFDNIVHAGSVIVNGSARGVVTEVGRYTYAGAKFGSIPCVSRGRRSSPQLLSLFKKYGRALGIALLLIVLPFSVLCMFIGGSTLSLFTSFMTAIAIAASTAAQFSTTVYKCFFTLPMGRCISEKNPSIIRSSSAMDRLASADYLFVLDGAALGDGALHYDRICCAEGEIFLRKGETVYASARKLGELAALYNGAGKESLSASSRTFGRYDSGLEEFVERVGTDKGALDIRCSVAGFAAANSSDPHDKLFYTDMGEKYMLSVSYADGIINECAEIFIDGKREKFSTEGKLSMMNKYKGYAEEGKKVLVFTLCRHEGYAVLGTRCFIGMLVLSENTDASAKKSIAMLERGGLKTVFFKNLTVDTRKAEVSAIPSEMITGVRVTPSDFEKGAKPLSYGLGKIQCYDSFSDLQVCELIAALHKKGNRVAVLGFSHKYERIYNEADLLITCSSDEYSIKGSFEQEIDLLHTFDDPTKDRVAQVMKQSAEIVVPRPNKKNTGGFASLCGAQRASRLAYNNAADFFRYVLYMQIVRMILVMVPMLFGSSALDARHVLLGGMFADLFVLLSFAFERSSFESSTPYRSVLREFSSPLRSNAPRIICFAFGALLASLLPELLSLFSAAPQYIDKTEYSLILFVLFHLAVFGCVKYDRARKGTRRYFDAICIIYPAVMLAILVSCFFLPPISKMFGIEGFSHIFYLFIAPVPPMISVVLYFLLGTNPRFEKFVGKMIKGNKTDI